MGPIIPAGIFPLSLWSPGTPPAPVIPVSILCPELDPNTGERRSLDVSADPTLTALGLQLRTMLASGSAVQNDGHKLFSIRKNSRDAPALIEHEINRIVKPFVDVGTLEVISIVIAAGPPAGSRGSIKLTVKLLRSGEIATLTA